MTAAIGIDLGATHIRAAVVDADGTLTGAVHAVLPADADARRKAPVDLALRLLSTHPDRDIAAVGLAVAGTVADGVLTWSANLGLRAVDHRSELEAATGLPATVLNDARAAALAEGVLAATAGTTVMVTVGSGIGGGILIDGRLHEGTGDAGEIGHMVIDPDGPPCPCGNRGCWERLAGGRALDAAAADEARRHPGRAVTAASAATLAEAATSGDGGAVAVIESHAERFAQGLDSLCAVLAPHLLILGGGIIAREGPIRDAYLAAARTLHWSPPEIRQARLADTAGIVGAALAARQTTVSQGP